jgi:beta-glucosidase
MYIRDLIGSTTRPVKELKGFELIELQPNESMKVDFIIDESTIQYFTANLKWEAEAGILMFCFGEFLYNFRD